MTFIGSKIVQKKLRILNTLPEGTRIHQKPTASSEGAQLWDKHHLSLSWFRKAGPTIILNIRQDV